MMRAILSLLLAFALATLGADVAAQATGGATGSSSTVSEKLDGCLDSGFFSEGKIVTDLCWSCIFPVTVMGIPLGDQKYVPNNPAAPLCVCPGRTFGIPALGITLGYWNPEHIIEVVKNPMCLPVIGRNFGENMDQEIDGSTGSPPGGGTGAPTDQGIINKLKVLLQRGSNHHAQTGGGGQHGESTHKAYHNAHWIKHPVGIILDKAMNKVCTPKGGSDMDYLMFTEILPTWQSDLLALYTHPEGKLFARVYAQYLCFADTFSSNIRKPIEQALHCAGSWGSIYPPTGHIVSQERVDQHMMSGVRLLTNMHRFTLAKKQYGDKAVCANQRWLVYPKHQYRFQSFWPLPDKNRAVWTGHGALWWGGSWRKAPGYEDRLIVEFAFNQCCITFW
jgi:conjugal transfer pilus assembly protein TraU